MSKRELIDRIRTLNPTAPTRFLAQFCEADRSQYLQHLSETCTSRLASAGIVIPPPANEAYRDPRQLALGF